MATNSKPATESPRALDQRAYLAARIADAMTVASGKFIVIAADVADTFAQRAPEHGGGWQSVAALQAAAADDWGDNPRDIARQIVRQLQAEQNPLGCPLGWRVDVDGPGYLVFTEPGPTGEDDAGQPFRFVTRRVARLQRKRGAGATVQLMSTGVGGGGSPHQAGMPADDRGVALVTELATRPLVQALDANMGGHVLGWRISYSEDSPPCWVADPPERCPAPNQGVSMKAGIKPVTAQDRAIFTSLEGARVALRQNALDALLNAMLLHELKAQEDTP